MPLSPAGLSNKKQTDTEKPPNLCSSTASTNKRAHVHGTDVRMDVEAHTHHGTGGCSRTNEQTDTGMVL